MKTIILIMIINNGDYRGGVSSTEVEFSSLEMCRSAAIALETKISQSNHTKVIAWGCYEK